MAEMRARARGGAMRGRRTIGGIGLAVVAFVVLVGPARAQVSTTTTSTTSTSTSTTTTTAVTPSDERERVVIVATAADIPRALDVAGNPPVLLTGTAEVPSETVDAIKAIRPERIIVVGDTATVSDAAFAQLELLGAGRLERLAASGSDVTTKLDQLLPPDEIEDWQQWILFGLVFLYIVLIFVLRIWLNTIPRAAAIAACDDLKVEVADGTAAAELLALADHKLRRTKRWPPSQREVLAAWRLIHDADRAQVPHRDVAAIRARAAVLAGLLAKKTKPEDATLREQLSAALTSTAKDKTSKDKADKDDATCLRAPLAEALRVYYDRRDDYFENLASWDRRLFWLTLMGIAGILAGGTVLHRETLFLAGAIGGVISRMTRAQRRRLNANDYGLSWSMLMLSPVVGALAGWAGSLIVNALASTDIGVFKPRLGEGWDHPLSAIGLTVALVLGFSERLLRRLFGTAEEQFSESPGTDGGSGGQTGGTANGDGRSSGGGADGSDDEATTPTAATAPQPSGGTQTTVTVPDAVGIDGVRARAWLEALGLCVEVVAEPGTPEPTAAVVDAIVPAPGTVVELGSAVTLHLTTPPEEVGMEVEVAVAVLRVDDDQ